MVLGIPLATYTLVHVLISLVGIAAGLVALRSMTPRITAVFLTFTILTSVTGFGFPFDKVLPSHVVGVVSLVVLAAAIVADYVKHRAGAWRTTHAVGVVLATYLNVFVLVAQLFKRIPVLFLLAPTQSEPPFALTQGLVLVLFIWLGGTAVKGFRPRPID